MEKTPEGYPVPRSSEDLYSPEGLFQAVYGDDVFFVVGSVKFRASRTSAFSECGDVDFILGEQVAWNPNPPEANDPNIIAARRSFAAYRAGCHERFPTSSEVLSGAFPGLQRLSAGGFMFVVSDFSEGPEARLALFRRTFGQRVLTDANGLVGGAHTTEKEMAEEYTPVLLPGDGSAVVLAIKMSEALSDAELIALKRRQEAKIFENLPLTPDVLDYRVAVLEPLPLRRSEVTIRTQSGEVVDRLNGSVGFEHDNNTLVCREAGLLRVPFGMRVVLVDGEFDRPGGFYTQEEFRVVVCRGDALSSTAALGRQFLKNWPSPVSGQNKRSSLDWHY